MKLKSLLFVAMLALTVNISQAQTLQEAVAKFDEAKTFIQAKDFAKAIPALDAVLKAAEAVTDDQEGAMAMAEDVKKLIPQMYLFNGVTLIQAKKFEDGISQLLAAEEMAVKYGNQDVKRNASRFVSSAYMAMGADAFNNKKFAEALEIFKKGYDQNPSNIELAILTAKAYAETKDLANAAKLYGEVIAAGTENQKYAAQMEDAKKDVNNYFLVAAAEAAAAKNLEQTIACVDEIIKIDPKNDKATLLLMQCANNMKKYAVVAERGVAAAENQLTPETQSEVNLYLGVAYQNLGNNAKATEYLKKVTAGPLVGQAQQILKDLAAAATATAAQ